MTDINQLKATIEQLRSATLLEKSALADQALSEAEALFRAYDAQLAAQRVSIDNLHDQLGRQAERIGHLESEAAHG